MTFHSCKFCCSDKKAMSFLPTTQWKWAVPFVKISAKTFLYNYFMQIGFLPKPVSYHTKTGWRRLLTFLLHMTLSGLFCVLFLCVMAKGTNHDLFVFGNRIWFRCFSFCFQSKVRWVKQTAIYNHCAHAQLSFLCELLKTKPIKFKQLWTFQLKLFCPKR